MSAEWGKHSTMGQLIDDFGGSIKTGPFGTALKASEYTLEGVPLISVREIGHGSFHIDGKTPRVSAATTARLPEYLLEIGDIVFARKGGIERCSLVRKTQVGWFLGSDGIRLRPPKNCDATFLAYSLLTQSVKDWLTQHSTGSTMASLNQATIARLPILIPAIHEQRKIASFLSTLDDRITLLRETNATLEAIAQALFKSWFVDFDPVRAQLEGSNPEGMDEATARLFPDSFEESELGLVPKGWRVGKVDDMAVLKGGKQLEKSAFEDNGANPVFGGAGEMGRSNLSNASGFVITVGRVGAYCGQFFWHIGEAWVNNNASQIKPRNEAQSVWMYQWLKSVNMDLIKKGAAQPFVSNGDIAMLKITIPPEQVTNRFIEISEPIFRKRHSLHEQAQTLATLRDTLLPRLISGQLRLPEAQAAAEEALA